MVNPVVLAAVGAIAIPFVLPQARRLSCWFMLFLPFVWLYVVGGEFYLAAEAPDNASSSGTMRMAVWITPILLLLGAGLVELMIPAAHRDSLFRRVELPRTEIHPTAHLIICGIGVVLVCANLIYVAQNFGSFTTLATSGGSRQEIMSMRAEVAQGGGYLPAVLRGALGPCMALYFALDYIDSERSFADSWRLIVPATELLARFATLHRSPAIFLLAMLLLASRRRVGINTRTAVGLAPILGLIFIFISFYTSFIDGQDFSYGAEAVWDRIVLAPNFGLWNYFEVFPAIAPHTGGGNINVVNQLFMGGAVIPANLYIPSIVYGVSGASWNAVFIADLWADFGWPGMIIGPLVIAAILRLLDVYYSYYQHDRFAQACWFGTMFGLISALSAGFFSSLLSKGGVAVMFLLFLVMPKARKQEGSLMRTPGPVAVE